MPDESLPTLGRRALLAAAGATALAMPHVARAAIRTARFGFTSPDASHVGKGCAVFAAAVAAHPLLGSALRIEAHGASRLGDDVTMLKNVATGTLDGILVGTSVMTNMVAPVGVMNAPYLFSGAAQARAVLDGPIGRELAAASQKQNLPVLAWGENGLRHVTSSVPVRAAADLRGLKIRVPPAPIILDGFKALGAAPAPLAFTLVYEALRRGEFQAQENSISTIESAKLQEVQKYLCLTGHSYDAIAFVPSADLLEDLTEEQRVALAAAAQKGAVATREACDASARDGVARLRAGGMTVIEDVDIAGMQAATRPYLESLTATYGADTMRRLLALSA